MNMKCAFPMWAGRRIEGVAWTGWWRLLLGGGLLLFVAEVAMAGDARHPDHELARRLVQAGEILPLERILDNDKVRGRTLLEVELKKKHGVYVYEIELVDARGQVVEFRFAAKTGQVLREKME
ncbi:MAG: hypothetical protein H7836_08685 [Magnetococcus sp. YQC-3]